MTEFFTHRDGTPMGPWWRQATSWRNPEVEGACPRCRFRVRGMTQRIVERMVALHAERCA